MQNLQEEFKVRFVCWDFEGLLTASHDEKDDPDDKLETFIMNEVLKLLIG